LGHHGARQQSRHDASRKQEGPSRVSVVAFVSRHVIVAGGAHACASGSIRLLSNDNFRAVNMRSFSDEPRTPRTAQRAGWLALAVGIAAGVALALTLGPRMTPLIEAIR